MPVVCAKGTAAGKADNDMPGIFWQPTTRCCVGVSLGVTAEDCHAADQDKGQIPDGAAISQGAGLPPQAEPGFAVSAAAKGIQPRGLVLHHRCTGTNKECP
jgi:hypothetical protein